MLVQAEEKNLPAAPDPLASGGKVMIFLILIIALIVVLAWLVNKLRGTQLIPSQGAIRVIASQSLGMKERIAVVQIGEKQMVIGVTPQQITHLTDLDEPLPEGQESTPGSFQELLKKAIRS